MELLKKFLNKTKYDFVAITVIIVATTILLSWLYKWDSIDQNVPIHYVGDDTMFTIINAKLLSEQGWVLNRPRLGAPTGTDAYDFPTSTLHNADTLILKLCVLITGNPMRGYNLCLYMIYYLSAIIAYLVMRELGIKRWIATCTSVVFGFMPYISMRVAHFQLASVYFIPLSILLCVWLFEREDIFVINKNFFKNKRNIWTIFFIILISNNGIIYYPFFTCYLLAIVGVIKLIQTKKFKRIIPSILAIAGICCCIVIEMLPVFIHNWQNGKNAAAVVRGGFVEAEMYSLKLSQLFIPNNSKLAERFSERIGRYNSLTPVITENTSSYLGLFAIVGLIAIMLFFFMRKIDVISKRVHFLSVLIIFMLLLIAGNGLGAIFTMVITDSIRGYCRGVVFIFFMIMVGFSHIIEMGCSTKFKKIIATTTVILAIASLWESIPSNFGNYQETEANFYSDKEFIERIESSVDAGSMIYQMPYRPYPEGGYINELKDYDLLTGMVHSNTLKWSAGSMKGRETDTMIKTLYELELPEQIAKVKELGFSAIYIDRRAFKEDEIEALENEIASITGSEKMVSNNKNLSCFIFER